MSITVEQSKELNRLCLETRAATREWMKAMLQGPGTAKAITATDADDESLIEFAAYVFSLLEEPKR